MLCFKCSHFLWGAHQSSLFQCTASPLGEKQSESLLRSLGVGDGGRLSGMTPCSVSSSLLSSQMASAGMELCSMSKLGPEREGPAFSGTREPERPHLSSRGVGGTRRYSPNQALDGEPTSWPRLPRGSTTH